MTEATAAASNSPGGGMARNGCVFRTRIDARMVIVVGTAMVSCFYPAWSLRVAAPGSSVAALVIGMSSVAIVLALTVPCRYTLEDDHLSIRCGVTEKRIPYAEIHGIALSSSFLSAPAWSLRRVEIAFGRSSQLVSPQDRDRFVDELSRRCGLDVPAPRR